MSLSTTTDFNEAGTSAADMAAQKIVQANSAILSADVNTLLEKALRRSTYLDSIKFDKAGGTVTGATIFSSTVALNGAVTQTAAFTKSGAGATTRQRTTNASIGTKISTASDIWRIPTPLAGTTYTLDESTIVPSEGMQVTAWRGSVGAFDVTIEDEATTVLATLPSGTACGVTFTFYASGGWRITSAFGAVTVGSSP
jgi:hypothetical protein